MVWFYHRDDARLRLETRYDNAAAEYVTVLHHPDGRRETRRFATGDGLREWLADQEQRLAGERWTLDGPPEILLEGWPDKLPLV